jgi:hypothetical protein
MRAPLLALAFALLLPGCPMPESSAARMQTTASDFNTDVRFGRTSMAIDKVAPKEREEFAMRRKRWGGRVQIADYELISAKMVGDEDAVVIVKYDWYDVAINELHSSKLRQKWHSYKGTWLMDAEALDEGAPGLLGEAIAEDTTTPRAMQFPTVRIGD